MSDLQDMDTSDLDDMDEEDTDTQPSDTEVGTGVVATDTGVVFHPTNDSSRTDEESVEKSIHDENVVAGLKDARQNTDEVVVESMSDLNKTKIVDKQSHHVPVITVSKDVDQHSRKRSSQHMSGKLDSGIEAKQKPNKTYDVSEDAVHRTLPTLKTVDPESSKSTPSSKLRDVSPEIALLDQDADSKTTSNSHQKLFFGTEQESMIYTGEVEELGFEDSVGNITCFDIPVSVKDTAVVRETGNYIKVLSHNEETDTVRTRPFSDSVAAAYFGPRLEAFQKCERQHAEPYQLAEKRDVTFHVDQEELPEKELLSSIDLKTGLSQQVTNLDEDMEVDKIIGASSNINVSLDEVDAKLPCSFTVDEPPDYRPYKRESKVKWDDNIFLQVIDTEDNILIDEPVSSESWKEDEEMFDWPVKRETVRSPSWKQEIIEWNLRDFDVEACIEAGSQVSDSSKDEFSDVNKDRESSDMILDLINNYSSSLSDRILGDVLDTLSSSDQVLEMKQNSSTAGEKNMTTENNFQTDDFQTDTSSKVPDIYSCDSYSDFCRELETSDSGYKASVGVSFEESDEGSLSFEGKPEDEFPKIQICEPDDSEKDKPDDSENFIHDHPKDDNVVDQNKMNEYAERNLSESEVNKDQVDGYEMKGAFAETSVVDILEPESLSSLEYCEGVVLNKGLSEDQEYHEIMAALANEEYSLDDHGLVAGTAQDYGLIPGSDIEEGAASLEYCDWIVSEDECKFLLALCMTRNVA